MEPVICYRMDGPLPEAEAVIREALAAEGFGILTEVDVTGVLRAKLGVETKPYKILGACNPNIAHRAMDAEPRVGAFLPCGLALWEEPGGDVQVCLQDPGVIAQVFASEGLGGPAAEARERLTTALGRVARAA